ncbi:MAG: GNAT family N-acetyltransferase [Roseitalea sp.]|nr:GNAT family N-acetyltransferase [Roseitalea sp.]MBO6953146.1 GNAT family N-acetyltransferase [Rhizobiaceae bacterium]MBO6593493.1 GNAT family N-acetyltransferase [Roseitalea sp.]MBO6600889.1 GNAT family N-acetyltransferase [Roseitalea sp.]MBO6612570.1 GNAT family N-acetyltransferase [Roseitalea sp.]
MTDRAEVRPLARNEIASRLDDLARLRIAVFRAFPYLYDGDMDYERRYLATYLEADGAFVAGAFDGDDLVGAATAAPLGEHKAEFAEPFAARGLDPDDFFYFGESVLLADYRGQGVGVGFFELREGEARRQGFTKCLFSAVVRPANHPLSPAGYVPLNAFWRNRGYQPLDGLSTSYAWKDIGETAETEKPMEYWVKALA